MESCRTLKDNVPPAAAMLVGSDSVGGADLVSVIAFIIRRLNWIVSKATNLALLLVLVFLAYNLWDTWSIIDAANTNSHLTDLKPKGNPEEIAASFEELLEINPDVKGWLTVDDTNIDYPVVRGKDNAEYINRDIYHEFSLPGSIFMDYRNSGDFSDYYTIIYGHNMYPDYMFGELDEFLEQDYFEKHRHGSIMTKEKYFDVIWFASAKADAYDETIYLPLENGDEEERYSLCERIYDVAACYRDEVELTEQDQLVVLSTCSDTKTNGRIILFGTLKENKNNEQSKENSINSGTESEKEEAGN